MRRTASSLSLLVVALLFSGCAGPEEKLGRGLLNMTEFARGGEMRRAKEQTALWQGPDHARTTGFLRGLNRSLARTGIGIYETVTFPLPPFKPVLASNTEIFPDESVATKRYPYGGLVLPVDPVYPANFKPGLPDDSLYNTDSALGFSGGDMFPRIPGSRFRVFD